MDERINPFKKAGIILVVIGILDIGFMAYCISNNMSYSSSFNIFSIIAGIFLIRGGVKTARTVRWLSVFFATAFIGVLLATPITTPLGLLATQIKLSPVTTIGTYLFSIAFVAFLVWVYLQLSSVQSLELISQAGYNVGKPKSAFIAAVVLLAAFGGLMSALMNGESAERAKSLAKEQLGSKFNYKISSITTSGNSGSAIVTAYNSIEIRNVQVQW
ncbi:hypothetical protein A11A3_13875 [Alcanivorax hongdengensis A-11-3]|uniref:Uncharacterized protein n=1 Tax=Alcanivorax hongdengensis A-11-3 TaxID=1177179 RepID=L0W942_9GAMM|nr:hypothetical protein [Alcanivorax hongdengensis]EKF73446.1 hypothetical protein A11A3_13875 [Alcanivorax hongdengensis A-11-3]